MVIVGYLLGSIPTGLWIVKATTGKDIRTVESGRTGGTNAMRAAGLWAGLATALIDVFKATLSVWLAQAIVPDQPWAAALAPAAAILGHNYSIFLAERTPEGRLRLRGGAGGAPCAGGAIGLWAPSILIILPMGALILYFVGYASVATLSAGFVVFFIFLVRAWLGLAPWEYLIYGVLSILLLAWALRPNLKRLMNGTERLVGFRARRKAQQKQSGGE
jgi:glycerol-3-phosphate acyltransferase PlsY